jgi:hypothetical protein
MFLDDAQERVNIKWGVFEKSPVMSCRASARHPFQEIPRFTRDDKKEGRDDRKEGSK